MYGFSHTMSLPPRAKARRFFTPLLLEIRSITPQRISIYNDIHFKGAFMQNLVSIYEENIDLIQKFILASIQKVGIVHLSSANVKHLFSVFPSLELAYETDEGFVQTSPNYNRHKIDHTAVGVDRSYLIDERKLRGDYYFHEPYLSTTTGHLCITIVYRTTKGGYILLDFQLRNLLERFMLIEKNGLIKLTHRTLYGIIGGGLLFFAIFVVLHGMYTFGLYLFGAT